MSVAFLWAVAELEGLNASREVEARRMTFPWDALQVPVVP